MSTTCNTSALGASRQANDANSYNTDIGTVAGATVGGLAGLAVVGGGAYITLARCACNKVFPLFGGGYVILKRYL